MPDIWGEVLGGKIIHAFIEAGLKGNLDTIDARVIPHDVLLCMGEEVSKDDTETRVVLEATVALAKEGMDPDTSTKGAEFAELGCVAWVKSFKSRRPVAFDGKTIFDNVKVVIECIWPETRAKSGASTHGAECIINSLVGPYDGTILVPGICTSGIDSLIVFFKKSKDKRSFVKFTTLVKDDILIGWHLESVW
jgi:hypothetical protein